MKYKVCEVNIVALYYDEVFVKDTNQCKILWLYHVLEYNNDRYSIRITFFKNCKKQTVLLSLS